MTTLTVGAGQQFTTLTAAVAAARSGDTIDVQAGTYTNDFPGQINGLTIEGVGGIAKFVATAQPGNGKAILDVAGNTTLKNLDLSGVTVPDGNGAAIRYESGNLVISNTAIHGNQDGLLGAASSGGTIDIENSEIYGNGSGTGNTHNLYIGDIATFTLNNSYVHDANTGHEVKSRAETNVITNNRIQDGTSSASYGIDLPNGGNATITGNTIQKSQYAGNPVSIAYGEEVDLSNNANEHKLNGGTTVTIANNSFVSDLSNADVLWDETDKKLQAAGSSTRTSFQDSGNSYYNYAAVDKDGIVSSNGFTRVSTRPTLNTASPITTSGTGSSSSQNGSGGNSVPTGSGGSTAPATADTTPPTLTVAQSISGTTTSTGTTLSGTVSDSGSGVAAVEIFQNSAGRTTDLGQAKLSGGTWSYTVGNLSPGTYTFYAVGFDKAGNTTAPVQTGPSETVTAASQPSQPTQPARDTTPPTVTVAQSISGTTTSTGNLLSGTVSDSGSGVAAVEIFVNSAGRSTDIGAATLSGSNWSYTVSNLNPGTYTFYAVGFDKAGNTTAPMQTGPSETVTAPAATSVSPNVFIVAQNGNSLVFGGTAAPQSVVTLTDKPANGQSFTVGKTTADSDGSWTISTQSVSTGVVNSLTATAAGSTSGSAFILASTASDTLTGTAGKPDVFAFAHVYGNDVINGFATTAAAGTAHDVIDLASTGYGTFAQLKPLISGTNAAVIRFDGNTSITLNGVSANSLQASDFRFS